MVTTNLPTLKINKMTQAQYDRELAAGNISELELYLTPYELEVHTHQIGDIIDLNTALNAIYATFSNYYSKTEIDAMFKTYVTEVATLIGGDA